MKFSVLKKSLLPFVILLAGVMTLQAAAGTYQVKSPDGKIDVTVTVNESVTWQVAHEKTAILLPSKLSMSLSTGEVLGEKAIVTKAAVSTVNTSFKTPFYKKSEVIDHYNLLTIQCKGDYAIEFRAYNDGAAYRFTMSRKGEVTVAGEVNEFNFDNDYKVYVPYVNDMRQGERYSYSFESFFTIQKLSGMTPDSLSEVPILVDLGNNKKAAILNAGHEDYPGMFLKINPAVKNSIISEYPGDTEEFKMAGTNIIATKRHDYIAQTNGLRTFPWKAVIVSENDKDMANNDMCQKLASPSRIEDTSWIVPGKAAWDWWNSNNLFGVDFVAGKHTKNYKFYIDFAAANGLEYVLIDAGWSGRTLKEVREGLSMEELIQYGKEKGVGLILWASWASCEAQCDDIFPFWAKKGIMGFKLDFFDSDDQKMVKSMYRIAEIAAQNKLILDYHGMKANGIQRTYPNIINFEGIKGLENYRWAPVDENGIPKDNVPQYDVIIPFTRQLIGPMDYTPGGMNNKTLRNYRTDGRHPMTQGTRAHQVALYTVLEAPVQMLADSPSSYIKEQETTDFIAQIPTVFDRTEVLDGKVAEYIITARQKDGIWYIGALTNWDARELTVDFSFLEAGVYKAEIMQDGANASSEATDYKKYTTSVKAGDTLKISLAPGGGWSAIITPFKVQVP